MRSLHLLWTFLAALAVPGQAAAVNLTKLPLGTNKVTSSPKRGYLNLCTTRAMEGDDGQGEPSWVHGTTWNYRQKLVVQGRVSWADARFAVKLTGTALKLTGNALPVGETTGVFPPSSSDPASAFRPSRSKITANAYSLSVPRSPRVASRTTCISGEVGVLKDGVPLYDAVDAANRDAVAEEVEDHCQGHPNDQGYHAHWVPTCLSDPGKGQSVLMGYAFDGFGIYGHRGANGRQMTNADLDACHGTTSTVVWHGRKVRMYHYVATYEFPYTVGCFRGTPTIHGPAF